MNLDTQLPAFSPAICDAFQKKALYLVHVGKIRPYKEDVIN